MFYGMSQITHILLLLSTISSSIFASDKVVFDLTILHTNDIHGRYEETDTYLGPCTEDLANAGDCVGGYARRVTKVKEIRDQEENVLLLEAGDRFLGQPDAWFEVYEGLATANFMNKIGYNASTFGKSDFLKGIPGLLPFLNNIIFPVVMSNVDSSQEPRMQGLYVTDHVYEFVNGGQVGIVGYLWDILSSYTDTGGLLITPYLESVQEAVDSLISRGINKIIGLGHTEVDSIIMARSVRGLDVVVTGTNYTFLYTGDPPSVEIPDGPYPIVVNPDHAPETSIPVVTTQRWGKYLGYFKIGFNEEGEVCTYDGNPILLDNFITQDPDALAAVKAWKEPVEERENEDVGDSWVHLTGLLDICMDNECNLGNLLADAMVWEWSKNSTHEDDTWTDVTIAITNVGSFNGNSKHVPGPITVLDVRDWLQTGDNVHLVDIKGKDIKDALENAASWHGLEGAGPNWQFLQVSGMKIVFDMIKPVGQRVRDVQVLCRHCEIPTYEPLERNVYYRAVFNSWLIGGGDYQYGLRDNRKNLQRGTRIDHEVLRDYIRTYGPVTTGLDGRIVVYDSTNRPQCPLPLSGNKQRKNN